MAGQMRDRRPISARGRIAAGFLAFALCAGGGGSPAPLAELAVQLAFALAALAWVRAPSPRGVPAAPPRGLWLLAGACLAVPLIQLVPMPAALWQEVPGRGLLRRSLSLTGADSGWWPLSIAPWRTAAAVLALIPAVGTMLACATLDRRDRRALLAVVAAWGGASALLGAAQLAATGDGLRLYAESHRDWVTGFFANRNSAADGLLIAMLALAAWHASAPPVAPPRARARRIAVWTAQGALLLAAVLTGSRAGIALAGLTTVLVAALDLRAAGRRGAALARWLALVTGAAAALGTAALFAVPRFAGVAARFRTQGDVRTELWADTLFAAQQAWPWGTGVGTFVTAYFPVERLEVVNPTHPNRAHNDYLELVLETGLAGPLILALAVAVLARVWRRGWRERTVPREMLIFSAGSLLVIALHSAVDYPLRSMTLGVLCAMAAGFAAPCAGRRTLRRGRDDGT